MSDIWLVVTPKNVGTRGSVSPGAAEFEWAADEGEARKRAEQITTLQQRPTFVAQVVLTALPSVEVKDHRPQVRGPNYDFDTTPPASRGAK